MINKCGSKRGPKAILILAAVFAFCTCIDPYKPVLTGYESLLVIDGLLTDANSSYTVKLSRTFQEQNSNPVGVSDAIVFITDDSGNENHLLYKGNGIYKSDSIAFKGSVGRTYILHIKTKEGKEYESDPCFMQSVPEIDSIYVVPDRELVNNGTEVEEGARIYLDSEEGDNSQYYRWAYEETWKFKVPNPHKYDYINDSTIPPVSDVKEYCWKSTESGEILIHSVFEGQSARIEKEPILFITSDQSDRLLIQYSILISQYSISKNEFDFWNNMKQINDNSGDIFAKQPFSVVSNLHNINDPKERVLGYFQVSAVKEKRRNLPFSEIVAMDLPFYHYPCERLVKEPLDFQTEWGPIITWDDVYRIMSVTSPYILVEPIYIPSSLELQKLVFTTPECANCELTGTRTKPDFWVDMK
jgi:hypothetical protein